VLLLLLGVAVLLLLLGVAVLLLLLLLVVAVLLLGVAVLLLGVVVLLLIGCTSTLSDLLASRLIISTCISACQIYLHIPSVFPEIGIYLHLPRFYLHLPRLHLPACQYKKTMHLAVANTSV
jgi:hypothetical protein